MTLRAVTKSGRETQRVAGLLARQILKDHPLLSSKKKAVILALSGDLGTGKTTFIQGFAKGLGVKEKILSPTFVILKIFKIPKKSHLVNKLLSHSVFKPLNHSITRSLNYLYHLDCYRIDDAKEISDLGFKEIIADPRNIVIIEWAERIKKILPKSAIWLKFEWLGKNERKIIINCGRGTNHQK